MGEKIKRLVASRKFFWLVVLVFVLQGAWFAGSLRYNLPPDESYHFTFTKLYAQEPISHGPFITHEPHDYLIFLGDVQQTPSFIYHYSMSFALRIISHWTGDTNQQVVALRLIGVAIGALSLLVLDRIFRRIKAGAFISNLALAILVSTGMFSWINAAVNYDSMSMLWWFLLLLCILRLQEKISFNNVLQVVLFSVLTVITKVTYAPVIVALLIAYLFINRRHLDRLIKAVAKPSFNKGTVALITVCIVVFGLAVGRIGLNAVRYHSVSPSCQAVHGATVCASSTALQRDRQVHAAYLQFKRAGGHVDLNPLTFAGDWSDKMYQRLFFFFGRRSILTNRGSEVVLALGSVFVGYLLLTKKSRLIDNDKELLLALALGFYVSALFLLNYHSYLTTGTQSGYQGRYLLPVVPIAYVFILKLTRQTYKRLAPARKPVLIVACVVLLALFLYEDFPALVFLKGTGTDWYSPHAATFNLKLKHAMMKSHLFKPDELGWQ